MISDQGFITAFTRTSEYFHTHLNGLTHADAVVQPPVPGNCILWIVGHIIHYRNNILRALEHPPVMDASRFAKDSAPVLADEPGIARLETLIAAYDESQLTIFASIRQLSPEQCAEVITIGSFTMPRAELLMTYMRHESYHTGQLELLREIALHARK